MRVTSSSKIACERSNSACFGLLFCLCADLLRPVDPLAVAVLSRRHPSNSQPEGADPVARVTYVAALIGDLEDFVGEVFKLTCTRENVPAAKFLIASEPAAYRGFGRHPRVRTDGPKAFNGSVKLSGMLKSICPIFKKYPEADEPQPERRLEIIFFLRPWSSDRRELRPLPRDG
jgi:hypothetical protein